ncbi:hypothetical protein GH714_018335 [Hevea brasiliensis]|uniref:Uncharacterized protein n=1 Tax=Hevea brasiliensis TaxID=3981 RepID=A0A6A6N6D5_HEVBR|nr:hypothetical protein GH714_018335 [Hevea brasiliensis]
MRGPLLQLAIVYLPELVSCSVFIILVWLSTSTLALFGATTMGQRIYPLTQSFMLRRNTLKSDFLFVRDKGAKKELQVQHISTLDQIVDLLTKVVSRTRRALLRDKLTIRQASLELLGRDRDKDLAPKLIKINNLSKGTYKIKRKRSNVYQGGLR